MSWNIKTPGDYINGPLTVAGTATITGNLTASSNIYVPANVSLKIGPVGSTWGGLRFDSTNQAFLDSDIGITFRTGGASSFTTSYQIGATGISTWSVAGSTAMTLNSTGLGIGASPNAKLQVSNGASVDSGLFTGLIIGGSGAGSARTASFIKDTTTPYNLIVSVQDFTGGTTGSFIVRNGSTDQFRIDSSGNVGVGVTPSAWKANYKAIQIGAFSTAYGSIFGDDSGNTNFAQQFFQGTSNRIYIANGNAASYRMTQAGQHQWFTDSAGGLAGANVTTFTQAMTLNASGNLLIGSTGTLPSRLHLSGDTGTTNWAVGPYTSAATNFYITANNSAGVFLNSTGATAWSAISDERFKDIIEPIINAVSKVGALRAVIGKFKTDPEGTRRSFLIAQDLLAAFPEVVIADNPDKLAVTYTEIIPLLVAAIKELTARVQTLEAR